MTARGSSIYGDVINKDQVSDLIAGDVAANTKLEIGFVYQDAANGWKQAPIDGSVPAKNLYWNDRVIDNTIGAKLKGSKTGTFYGAGAIVIGQADAAIPLRNHCKTSDTNAAHAGQLKALTVREDSLANFIADLKQLVAIYIGHSGEDNAVNNDPTAATDAEKTCLFLIVRGY